MLDGGSLTSLTTTSNDFVRQADVGSQLVTVNENVSSAS